jgi:hypothetical protein
MGASFFSNFLARFLSRPSRDIAADGSTGLLGAKLETAWPKCSLNTWFMFEKFGEPVKIGDLVRSAYKPSGPSFKPLTTLEIDANSEGMIRSLSLSLARSFIGHPSNGIFAADLAKSFLRVAVPQPDEKLIGTLATEIETRASTSQPMITRGERQKPSSGPGSRAYRIYAGQANGSWEGSTRYTRVRLIEERIEEQPFVKMGFEII